MILITGGSGQLGSDLRNLMGSVGVFHLAPPRNELDITDAAQLKKALDQKKGGRQVSALIHCAAYTQVDACEREKEKAFAVNEAATRELAILCAERGIPLEYVSTDFVFDGSKGSPYEIDDAPFPLNVYGESKLEGERAVREIGDKFYILRASWLFGAKGSNFPKAILAKAAAGHELRVVNDQVGSPTYSKDMAEAVLAILGMGSRFDGLRVSSSPLRPAPYGVYHVSNSGACSWFDFASEILRQSGWKNPIVPITSAELARPAKRPPYSVLSHKSINGVGLHARSWQEGLRSFLDELRLSSPELFPVEKIK